MVVGEAVGWAVSANVASSISSSPRTEPSLQSLGLKDLRLCPEMDGGREGPQRPGASDGLGLCVWAK